MTKIKIPKQTRITLGGGQSFISNLQKVLSPLGYEFITEGDYDVLFIAGATLCEKETFREAKEKGKPIILRVDNILEDGKNRNSGMSRLKEFAEGATVIVYQSEWAKRMLQSFCGNGIVIYNGVDTDIFYPRKERKDWEGLRIFYSKYSRNETKQFHEVLYWFREYNLEKKDDTLVLVGRYADDKLKIDHPFEFFNGENYDYKGVIQEKERIAKIMRSCDVAFLPYAFDACSNTILESQACGLPVIYSPTGGTPEIIVSGCSIDYKYNLSEQVEELIRLHNKFKWENFENFKNKFDLETMGERYHALIKTTLGKVYEI
jgi:glycosyltransferase involved in cell wall biosynthesis